MGNTNLLVFIEIYINEKKLNTERGTHKVMTTALNHLKSFQQQGIEYQEVTIAWIQKFVNYLYAEPRYHSRNFAGKMVDMVKQFMRAAQLRGYHRNEAYLNKDFRVKKTPVFDIALNHNDLNAISNADISEYSNLYEISRDYFLLGCYTGLRYSDWDKFQKQYIQTVNTTKYL
jgi:Phage integrase SAM-like domain